MADLTKKRRQPIPILLGVLVVIAIGIIALTIGNFDWLRGLLIGSQTNSFQGTSVRYGTLGHGDTVSVLAGEHNIFTCPLSNAAGMAWNTPVQFSAIPGLRIYEYTNGGTVERNMQAEYYSRWAGRLHGFFGRPSTFTDFQPGKVYYVSASQDFDFGCTRSIASSSSSSAAMSSASSLSCTTPEIMFATRSNNLNANMKEYAFIDPENSGVSDVVAKHWGDQAIHWYQNNGDGSFTDVNLGSLTGTSEARIRASDVDNDGDMDVVIAGNVLDNEAILITTKFWWIQNLGGVLGSVTEITNAGQLLGYNADFGLFDMTGTGKKQIFTAAGPSQTMELTRLDVDWTSSTASATQIFVPASVMNQAGSPTKVVGYYFAFTDALYKGKLPIHVGISSGPTKIIALGSTSEYVGQIPEFYSQLKIFVSDVNADGQNDIVVPRYTDLFGGSPINITWWSPTGTQNLITTSETSMVMYDLWAAEDIDGNGSNDLLVSGKPQPGGGSNPTDLDLLTFADGFWSSQTIIPGLGTEHLSLFKAANFDQHARKDLLLVSPNLGIVTYFATPFCPASSSSITFSSSSSLACSNPTTNYVRQSPIIGNAGVYTLIDTNNSGVQDVVVLENGLKWYRNNGNGTFAATSLSMNFYPPGYVNGSNINSMKASDVNNDGYMDIVISGQVWDSVFTDRHGFWWVKNNAGTLGNAVFLPGSEIAGQNAGNFGLFDMSGDGQKEIFTYYATGGTNELIRTTANWTNNTATLAQLFLPNSIHKTGTGNITARGLEFTFADTLYNGKLVVRAVRTDQNGVTMFALGSPSEFIHEIPALDFGGRQQTGYVPHVADIDVDGMSDLIWGMPAGWTDNIVWRSGTDTSINTLTQAIFGTEIISMQSVGDMDGDSRPEILATLGSNIVSDANLYILKRSPVDVWSKVAAKPQTDADIYYGAIVADINHDSYNDFLLRMQGTGELRPYFATLSCP